MNRHIAPPTRNFKRNPSGFTLVEMLVAIGLVLLMMTLFAQIFGLATEVMGRQKGLSENDQRARMLATILRNDIDKRTYRSLSPNLAGELGYFYISENITTNDADDVLQLTIQSNSASAKLGKTSPFYGRATFLHEPGDTNPQATYLQNNPNQPEADDGELSINNSTASQFAEVAYFIRGKNLYRRLLLLRVPPTDESSDTVEPKSSSAYQFIPSNSNYTTALVPATAPNGTGYFWQDFDYSAYNNTANPSHIFIHGKGAGGFNSLDNTAGNSTSLGIPKMRFGFHPISGLPVEFVNGGTAFIGRFTHQETSFTGFDYPGVPGFGPDGQPGVSGTDDDSANGIDDIGELGWTGSDDTNPYTRTDLTLTSDFVVQSPGNVIFNGPRVQEDLILSNVHAFDIKVLDSGIYLGADSQPGKSGVDDDGNGTIDDDSELGWPGSDDWLGPDGKPGVAGDGTPGGVGDDDNDGTDDNPEEIGWPGSDDAKLNEFRDLGHAGSSPQYRYGAAANLNNAYGVNRFDTWHPAATTGNGSPPYNPQIATMPVKFLPLQAIQIKIRYLDVASDQMREITLIQSLVD